MLGVDQFAAQLQVVALDHGDTAVDHPAVEIAPVQDYLVPLLAEVVVHQARSTRGLSSRTCSG